jgi:hypothetical protein
MRSYPVCSQASASAPSWHFEDRCGPRDRVFVREPEWQPLDAGNVGKVQLGRRPMDSGRDRRSLQRLVPAVEYCDRMLEVVLVEPGNHPKSLTQKSGGSNLTLDTRTPGCFSTPRQELFQACYRISVSEYLLFIGVHFLFDIESEHFVVC